MPQNKKHHYVPRFYLKRFSKNKKSINIFNLPSKRKILSASLKDQCHKKYFYGEESDVEKALSDLESEAARVFHQIDHSETLPTPNTFEYEMLFVHMLIQYGRTAYMADAIEEMAGKAIKCLFHNNLEEYQLDFDQFKIGLEEPGKSSLAITAQQLPFVLDLECKLVINRTSEDFVTSDNPVGMYNQLLSFRKFGSNIGLACRGLQIFLPISPDKYLLFFDPEVYRIGNQNRPSLVVSEESDVYQLNTLQMCAAAENVYFFNSAMNINALHRKAAPYLRSRKANVNVFCGYDMGEHKRELLRTSLEDIRTNLTLSFVKLTHGAKRWKKEFCTQDVQPATIVRNQQLCEEDNRFRKKVAAGEYRPSDFLLYLKERFGSN